MWPQNSGGEGGTPYIMALTGWLRPKALLFSNCRYINIYCCISLLIKNYVKMRTRLPKVGMLKGYFFNKRYIKGVTFMPKWYIKGYKGKFI